MIHILFSLIILFAPQMQPDCGRGLPCGPLPWRLPVPPHLASPTPIPTVDVTTEATPGTPTPTQDILAIQDDLATLQAVVVSTPASIANSQAGFDLGANAGSLWPYLMGLGQIHFGVFTPLIQFAVFALLFIVGIRVTLMLLPVIGPVVGIIRKIIDTLASLKPF